MNRLAPAHNTVHIPQILHRHNHLHQHSHCLAVEKATLLASLEEAAVKAETQGAAGTGVLLHEYEVVFEAGELKEYCHSAMERVSIAVVVVVVVVEADVVAAQQEEGPFAEILAVAERRTAAKAGGDAVVGVLAFVMVAAVVIGVV